VHTEPGQEGCERAADICPGWTAEEDDEESAVEGAVQGGFLGGVQADQEDEKAGLVMWQSMFVPELRTSTLDQQTSRDV